MKKIVIIKDNGGRLANQLWNFASIYSYSLEKNCQCENYSFFRYHHYFNIPINNVFYGWFLKFHQWHKNLILSKISYYIYYLIILVFFNKYIIRDQEVEFLLPPTESNNKKQKEIINNLCLKNDNTFYFCGWVFRNPEGLKKYHQEVRDYFRPKEIYYHKALESKKASKEKYQLMVGVHIRQGDYKTWRGGEFFFTCHEVAEILKSFLQQQTKFKKEEIVFVLCSDGPIEKSEFAGLNIVLGPGGEISDLYILAESDLIIGSSSTYGRWAAYYGGIPFFQFSREKIDWSKIFIPS